MLIFNDMNLLAMSMFSYGVRYNPIAVLLGFIILVVVILGIRRHGKKSENSGELEQVSPSSELFAETDVLGLQRKTTETLVSDRPGIKNPGFTFSIIVLIIVVITGGFAIKLNNPELSTPELELTQQEKSIKFYDPWKFYGVQHYYGVHDIYWVTAEFKPAEKK